MQNHKNKIAITICLMVIAFATVFGLVNQPQNEAAKVFLAVVIVGFVVFVVCAVLVVFLIVYLVAWVMDMIRKKK
uniref:Uncharacterized protein n=1 Tax=Prevotella sp. GTC17262 TaxID=3236797 RepID=A0AB33JHG1_9BACT